MYLQTLFQVVCCWIQNGRETPQKEIENEHK